MGDAIGVTTASRQLDREPGALHVRAIVTLDPCIASNVVGGDREVLAAVLVVVSLVPVDSVLVSPDSAEIYLGGQRAYSAPLFDSADESLHHLAVELCSGATPQFGKRLLHRQSHPPIHSIDHHVVCVDNRQDSSTEWRLRLIIAISMR